MRRKRRACSPAAWGSIRVRRGVGGRGERPARVGGRPGAVGEHGPGAGPAPVRWWRTVWLPVRAGRATGQPKALSRFSGRPGGCCVQGVRAWISSTMTVRPDRAGRRGMLKRAGRAAVRAWSVVATVDRAGRARSQPRGRPSGTVTRFSGRDTMSSASSSDPSGCSVAPGLTHGSGRGCYRSNSRCSMSVNRTSSRLPARRPPSWKYTSLRASAAISWSRASPAPASWASKRRAA